MHAAWASVLVSGLVYVGLTRVEHCVYSWSALISLASTIYRGADPVMVEVGNRVKRALCVFRQLPPVTPRVCPTV